MLLKAGDPVGLTQTVLDVLSEHGIVTVERFLKRDPHSLPLDPALVLRLQREIYSKHTLEPETLSSLGKQISKNYESFSTGDRGLDQLLGGGFLTGEHVDVCGERDIRSDFCLRVMSELLRNDASASIIYIESASNFFPEKLLSEFGCELERLRNVQVVFLDDMSKVLEFLDQIQKSVFQTNRRLRPKMIVLNSFVDLVKSLMIGNDPITSLGILNHVATTIRCVAYHKKLSFLTTNDLIRDQPSLGKMWSGAPHIRVAVRSLEDTVVMKSTRKLENS